MSTIYGRCFDCEDGDLHLLGEGLEQIIMPYGSIVLCLPCLAERYSKLAMEYNQCLLHCRCNFMLGEEVADDD